MIELSLPVAFVIALLLGAAGVILWRMGRYHERERIRELWMHQGSPAVRDDLFGGVTHNKPKY